MLMIIKVKNSIPQILNLKKSFNRKLVGLLILTVLFSGIFCFQQAHASSTTYVSGPIASDTTWTLADSPYVVQGAVSIYSGVTLTIEPGVVVKFYSSLSTLKVYGTLNAQGTASEPIYFTSFKDDQVGGDTNGDGQATQPALGDWAAIHFYSGSSSNISQSIIRYGGHHHYPWLKGAVIMQGGTLDISDSRITTNQYHGINVYSGTLTVTGSEIDHSEHGLYQTAGEVTISQSSFHDNQYYGTYSLGGELTLTSNNFQNNYGAIYITGAVDFTHSDNSAANNQVNGIVVWGFLIKDQTWNPDIPYIITSSQDEANQAPKSSLIIRSGVTLTIQPGVVVKFYSSLSTLKVYGTLNAQGTASEPIYFTSFKDDVGGDTNGDGQATQPAPGDWAAIHFYSGSNSNISQSIIRYGGHHHYPWLKGVVIMQGGTLDISDSQITANQYCGINVYSGTLTVTGSEIDHSDDGLYQSSGTATISQSSFHDLTQYGVYNYYASTSTDARNNWWGDPSGPYHPTLNPDGLGVRVSNRVDFVPWLGHDPAEVRLVNVAVILAEPSNKSFEGPHDKIYFRGIIDQVMDYYCENSFGKWDIATKTCNEGSLNLNFDLYDNEGSRYKLSRTQEHYGKNFLQNQEIILGFDGNGKEIKLKDNDRTEQFVWDAINKADEDINYNNYQSVIVVYAGDSEQKLLSLQKYRLGTQEWSLSFPPAPVNSPAESINNWISVSENETKYAWVHESGHALGKILTDSVLCDLYPTANPCSYGGSVVDYFDVMGTRTILWGHIKDIVSYFSSFSRIKLGWFRENAIGYGSYLIESLETMKFGEEVARYNISPDSYYLLEARTNDSQYSKWDTDLPNDPLVIYKVSPKEITVNNQTITVDFVNVADTVGAKVFSNPLSPPPIPDPLDLPFKDPINNVLIGINNRIAESDSFKINTQVSEYSISNYIGVVLKPKLSLLEKIWQFALTPFKIESNGKIIGTPVGLPHECPVSVLGYEIRAGCDFSILGHDIYWGPQSILWAILGGLPFLLILLILFLFLLRFSIKKITPKIENKATINTLQKISRVIWGIIIFLAIILIVRLLISPTVDSTRLWVTIEDLSLLLILPILFFLLLGFWIKKITPKIESKATINTLQKISRVIWGIIIFLAIILIIRLLTFSPAFGAPGLKGPSALRRVSYKSVAADLDLHAYTSDGKHVGLNYETGEYENKIPEAEASGDLVYDDEWIFVPEGAQAYFVVSSKDVQEMLETYPELQELTEGVETYEAQAIYYDEASQRYESNVVTEQIEPGVLLEHQVSGTYDIAIGPGALMARVDFDPDTLNLKSKGKWATVYIELPAGYDANEINLETIKLNNQVQVELKPTKIGDYDNNGIPDLMVKFKRSAIQNILEEGVEVEITITGELINGSPFRGSDTIRVISKGKEVTVLTVTLLACVGAVGLFAHKRKLRPLNGLKKTIKRTNNFIKGK